MQTREGHGSENQTLKHPISAAPSTADIHWFKSFFHTLLKYFICDVKQAIHFFPTAGRWVYLRHKRTRKQSVAVWWMFLLYLLLQSRFQTQHRLKDVLLEGRWMENVPRAFTKHWKKGVKNQRVHVGVSVSIPANRSGSWRTTSESVDSGSECWSYPFPLKTKCQMLAVVFLFCFFSAWCEMCKSNETFGNQPVKWCELLIVNPPNMIPASDQTSGTFSILNEVFPFFTIHQSNVFFLWRQWLPEGLSGKINLIKKKIN